MIRHRLLIFSLSFFLFACTGSDEQKEEEVAVLPPQYYYYPRANVYFDSANKTYFFQSGDSATWQSAGQIPAMVQAMMDKSAFIAAPSDPVWKDNENHRLVYSASLYATASDTAETKSVRKPTKKLTKKTEKDSADAKQRKGFGRLLDKIFGGDKDKKKEEKQ